MFRVVTCLFIVLEISPQDSGNFDIVISFQNDDISVIRHSLLLTPRNFMVSSNSKYSMMVCIISGGRSIKLADIGPVGPLDVLGR